MFSTYLTNKLGPGLEGGPLWGACLSCLPYRWAQLMSPQNCQENRLPGFSYSCPHSGTGRTWQKGTWRMGRSKAGTSWDSGLPERRKAGLGGCTWPSLLAGWEELLLEAGHRGEGHTSWLPLRTASWVCVSGTALGQPLPSPLNSSLVLRWQVLITF